MEIGYSELNDWAGKIADKTNPEELWDTLMNKEARIAKLEEKQEEIEEDVGGAGRACTCASFEARLDRLEEAIHMLQGEVSEAQQEMKKGVSHQGR